MEEIGAVAVLYLLDERAQAQHVGREDDLRAVAARRLDLRLRRGLRHGDGHLRADGAAGVRDGLGGVAGAHRHDPVRTLLGGQAEDRVHGAPRLERARPLEVLGLEERSRADPVAQGATREQRGPGDVSGDERAGPLDIREGDGQDTLLRHEPVAGTRGPAWIRTKDQQIMSPPL